MLTYLYKRNFNMNYYPFKNYFEKNQLIAHSSYPVNFQFYGACNLSLIKTVFIDAAEYLESFYLRSNRRKNMK